MKRPGIKRILVPLCAALFILIGTFAFTIYKIEENDIKADAGLKLESVEDLMRGVINRDIKHMSGLLRIFMKNERIAAALRARDRTALYDNAAEIFGELRSQEGLTHLYFSGPDRVNVLRVHMPDTYGDKIERLTTIEAERTGSIFGGIELGPLGTLTVRVVAPWYDTDGLIGFIELGEEIEHITRMLHSVLNVELYVAVHKELLDKTQWEEGMHMLGREPLWSQFPNMVIVDSTGKPFPKELAAYIDESNHTSKLTEVELSMEGRTYHSRFLHLNDAGGRSVGELVMMIDGTEREMALRTALIRVGLVCSLVWGALLWFFHFFWGRIEKQLDTAHDKILELERDRSRFILDNTPAHISPIDENGCFTHWSPYSERLFGYTTEEAVGRIGLTDLLANPEEDCSLPKGHGLDGAFETELEGRDKNNSPLWLKVRLVSMPEREGESKQLCIVEDISAHKKTERALLDSEERYRVLFNRGNDAVFVHGLGDGKRGGNFIEVNEVACEKLGYTREDLMQMTPADLDGFEKPHFLSELLKKLLAEKSILFETVLVAKDGLRIPVEVNSHLFEFKGKPTILSVARDISERKRAGKERIQLATAMEQVAEGVLITDTDWKITYMNSAFENISGFGREEAVGKHPRIFKSGEYGSSFFKKITETLRKGEVWSGRFTSRRKDGTSYEVAGTITPIRSESGEISNYVTVERDITHEAQLEKQLRRAQKMDALGRLAGGIAHDFNNVLAAIMGNIELSLLLDGKQADTSHNLQQALVASNRAKELVAQILTFSRQGEQERKPLQLGLIIKETLSFLRASLPTTIEIKQYVATRELVEADPSQIHQMLVNLCTNAAHSMREEGGILEVTLGISEPADQPLAHPLDLSDGNRYLKLTVADTGHGMDSSIVERIFEPYFTTKKPGEGTGLGLAMVHGIVTGHGGAVTVRSEPGAGSAFHIFLPGMDREIVQEEEVKEDLPTGSERILLVDDEKSLTEVGSRMLEYLGYRISAVTSSLEALDLFRAAPDQFDLIITDHTMPHMTGLQLAEEIVKIRPAIPVVLCTGFSEKVLREPSVNYPIRTVLMKPVILKQLAETVRTALGRSGG